jgi:Zn-dependent M16 (insulinase) family peptidase
LKPRFQVGRPSAAFATESEAKEKARLEARKAELGEAKLQQLGAALEAANTANDEPYAGTGGAGISHGSVRAGRVCERERVEVREGGWVLNLRPNQSGALSSLRCVNSH